MSIDLSPQRADQPAAAGLPLRRWAWVLLAGSAWTFYVWITRAWNIARSSNTTQFKVAHYVLAVVSLAFATASGVIGVKMLRRR